MKAIKINNFVSIFLSDGTMIQKKVTEKEFTQLNTLKTDNEIKKFLFPDIYEKYKKRLAIRDYIKISKILTIQNDSIYWKDVSKFSLPVEFVMKIIEAEQSHDEDKLKAYKNFWALLSLNPDDRCRKGLFKFLIKDGFIISEYGLFIAYKNVERLLDENKNDYKLVKFVKEKYEQVKKNKKSPKRYVVYEKDKEYHTKTVDYSEAEKDPYCLDRLYQDLKGELPVEEIFTDIYSHSFKIKIGEYVTMPKEKCDSNPNHGCSYGLHVSSDRWLNQNKYGYGKENVIGLVCLVNPVDVIAVPEDIGKLRTCKYLPITTVSYDKNKNIIPYTKKDGFKTEYIKKALTDIIETDNLDEEKYKYKFIYDCDFPLEFNRGCSDDLLKKAKDHISQKYEGNK